VDYCPAAPHGGLHNPFVAPGKLCDWCGERVPDPDALTDDQERDVATNPPNFEGHVVRTCGQHRTVGPHRAWCFDCLEWCYPADGCRGCSVPDASLTDAR
jgi:hypothetical protein